MLGGIGKVVFIKRIVSFVFFPLLYLYTKLLQVLFPIKCYSEEETRAKLYKEGSISRIGDGEINIILNRGGNYFQDQNEQLAKKLKEIMAIDMFTTPRFYVAINPLISTYRGYTLHTIRHWVSFNATRLPQIYWLTRRGQRYYDPIAFRITGNKCDDIDAIKKRIVEVKKIWKDKNVLVVEADLETLLDLGENSCLGVNSDFLSGAISVQRIVVPARNAFSKYDEILDAVCRNYNHDLVLLILGMTATVLAYDLYRKGIRAIDFGQTNSSYLYALEKYFGNEPMGEIITPEEWKKQIIEKIEEP